MNFQFFCFMSIFSEATVRRCSSKQALLKIWQCSETSQQRTCLEQRTKYLAPNVTIFVKLPLNSGHLLITDKFFKTRRCPLCRGSTILGIKKRRHHRHFHVNIVKFLRTAFLQNNSGGRPLLHFLKVIKQPVRKGVSFNRFLKKCPVYGVLIIFLLDTFQKYIV